VCLSLSLPPRDPCLPREVLSLLFCLFLAVGSFPESVVLWRVKMSLSTYLPNTGLPRTESSPLQLMSSAGSTSRRVEKAPLLTLMALGCSTVIPRPSLHHAPHAWFVFRRLFLPQAEDCCCCGPLRLFASRSFLVQTGPPRVVARLP